MTTGRQSKYERRVTLALKWFHLDHLTISDIQDKLLEEGYESPHSDDGRFSERTIKKWINSQESEEVLEQVRQRHANAREQIAERHEDLYQRARSAENQATKDIPIKGLAPVEDKVDGRLESPKTIDYSWRVVQPGEELPASAPEGADPERDTIIEIDPTGSTVMEPGAKYPKMDWKGEPEYEVQTVGVRRDEADRTQRSFLRQEQSSHLREKGEVMGVYEEEIKLSGSLDISQEVTVPDSVIEAVIKASRSNLAGEEE